MTDYEFSQLIAQRAIEINNGHKSHLHDDVVRLKISNAISIALYEYQNGALKGYKIERTYPNGKKYYFDAGNIKHKIELPKYK